MTARRRRRKFSGYFGLGRGNYYRQALRPLKQSSNHAEFTDNAEAEPQGGAGHNDHNTIIHRDRWKSRAVPSHQLIYSPIELIGIHSFGSG